MSDHLTTDTIRDYLSDRLDEAESAEVNAHLASCDGDCIARLRAIEAEEDEGGSAPGPITDMRRRRVEYERAHRVARDRRVDRAGFAAPAIEGYEVFGCIGIGGMGTVWAAFHHESGLAVALKVIRVSEFASAEDVERFHREAEAARSLSREIPPDGDGPTAIVPILDIGPRGGPIAYIAMDLIEHGTLLEWIGPLRAQPRETARIFALLAETLAEMHALGLIHRDIKPDNILLERRAGTTGAPKPADFDPLLADFGLAKRRKESLGGDAAAGDSFATSRGAIVGTPQYMSPEQIKDGSRPTPAMDVYSLGATLYHVLAGRPPFPRVSPFDDLVRIVRDYPTTPHRSVNRDNRGLWTICRKCMDKNLKLRYADAKALAEDLRRFEEGKPIGARPTGLHRNAIRWCRSNPGGAIGIGALTAVMAVLTIGWVAGGQLIATERRAAHGARVASARDLARRGDWTRALAGYREAIDDGRGDALTLRVERLFGFLAVNDRDTLDREVADLAGRADLGHLAARVDLARGASLLCDASKHDEGRAAARRALASRADLASGADRAFAEALVDPSPRNVVDRLREAVRLDPLHFPAQSSLAVGLLALGELQEARETTTFMRGVFPDSPAPALVLAFVALIEGKRPEMAGHLDELALKIGPTRAKNVAALRAYCENMATALDILERYEVARDRIGMIQWLKVFGALGEMNKLTRDAFPPSAISVPTVSLMHKTFETVLNLTRAVGRPPRPSAEILRDYPEALIRVQLLTNRLFDGVGLVDRAETARAADYFAATGSLAQEAADAPTILPRSPIRYQSLILSIVMDVDHLLTTPNDSKIHFGRLYENLPRLISGGRQPTWKRFRGEGMGLIIASITVRANHAQLVEWKPDTPEGVRAYRRRCEELHAYGLALIECWLNDEPGEPTAPKLRDQLNAWIKEIRDESKPIWTP